MDIQHNNEKKLEATKRKTDFSWFMEDKWFRILEFSLILAALHYFGEITKSIPLKIVYWLSWVILWGWFEDTGIFFVELINYNKKLSKTTKIISWIICAILVVAIYLLVTITTDLMISKQYS